MKKSIFLLFVIFSTSQFFGQEMTGLQLLEKAIEYHDPDGNWATFSGTFNVTMKTPTKSDRHSIIRVDLPNEYFNLFATQDKTSYGYILDKEKCQKSMEMDLTCCCCIPVRCGMFVIHVLFGLSILGIF